MMRVLWFSNTPASGADQLRNSQNIRGSGGWMRALNDALKDKLELHVVFQHPYRISKFKCNDTMFHPIYTGNIVVGLLKNRLGLKTVKTNKYLREYLDVIRVVKPDLIHIHGTESDFLCILKRTSIPVIVSIQGNITIINHKFRAGLFGKYISTRNIGTISDLILGSKRFDRISKEFSEKAKIEQTQMRDIKYIIGRTSWDYRITRVLSPNSKYFRGEELLREAFYNYSWNNLYVNGGKLIIHTTNGNNYYKGIETVFHALKILQEINMDVEWRIIGIKKSDTIVTICKKYLSSNFPRFGYKLLGSLSEEELIKELLESNMYVMPSHIENSPNNLCEAMMLGLPCIASFSGGTGSILEDNKEGILIQAGDPWVLAGTIVELMNDSNKSQMLGGNARKRALERHDRNKVVNQYLNIYKDVLK